MMTESQGIQRLPSVSGSLVKVGTNPDDKSINYSSVSLGNKGGAAEGASWHLNNKEDYLTAHPENMKLDLSYFMKALAAQVEYFVAKLNMYRWKETSTEDQVSDLYRRYVEYRTSLKIKSQVKSFGQMIDQIEGIMEDWIRQISQLEIDSQHQQSQIDGLKEIITELNQTQEKSRKNIMDLQDQLKKQIGPDIIQARREFEKNFASVSQAMKEEVVRAHQDKEALAVKVTELEAKISVFNLEKLKRESKNQSKEVQAIFQIGAVKESRQMLTDTINAPELAVAKGDGNSKNWLCAIMNHVLNARLAFELDQSKARQKVSTTSMKSFVIEALLVKFGSAQATETLLRDLIACIKKFSGEGERFKLFARFLGAEDILTQELVRRKKANKYEEFLTQYYYTSHLAVRDYLEFCLLVKGFEYHEDMNTLKPFISFPINKRSHLLKVDIARKIYVAFIINKEQKQLLDPEVLEEEFDNLLKEDLYDRLHEKGKEIKTKNVRNEEFYLSVDSLSRVLLERRLNQFMSFIQRFLSALTINSAARGEKNLFYDDLQYSCKMVLPFIGEGLIGHIFREIADTPQLQAYSLEKMIQSAVPTLVLINEADQPLNLLNLVITPEDNDQRNFLLREAEVQIEAKIKKNTAKKEGSRFAALIEGLSAFN